MLGWGKCGVGVGWSSLGKSKILYALLERKDDLLKNGVRFG